jgi:hypothetical protein
MMGMAAREKAGQEGVTTASKNERGKIKVSSYDSADYLKTEADIKTPLTRMPTLLDPIQVAPSTCATRRSPEL